MAGIRFKKPGIGFEKLGGGYVMIFQKNPASCPVKNHLAIAPEPAVVIDQYIVRVINKFKHSRHVQNILRHPGPFYLIRIDNGRDMMRVQDSQLMGNIISDGIIFQQRAYCNAYFHSLNPITA
jgi:hypothetical protein